MDDGGTAELSACAPTSAPGSERGGPEAVFEVFGEMYAAHYRGLVQMAALLTGSSAAAEDLVQDAFVRVLSRSARRAPDVPLAYLRTTVVNLARSRWRRARVLANKITEAMAGSADAQPTEERGFERLVLVAALRELPQRQREVVVLRYFLDLPVHEVADTLGIGTGTVKSYSARAMDALRARLGDLDERR